MKELSLLIKVIPQKKMRKELYEFMAYDYFQLQPVPNITPAGVTFVCDLDLIIDRPELEDMSDFSISRSCIIKLSDQEGNPIIVGSSDLPAKVIISPDLNTAHLRIKSTMLKSPLI